MNINNEICKNCAKKEEVYRYAIFSRWISMAQDDNLLHILNESNLFRC